MLRSADAAMYRAKQQGRCRVELYDEVLGARIRQRLDLQNELRAAIDRGDIRVHYQPISDLVTGRHVGVEALARWPHEVLGWIPPEDFIPVAERSGLILPLGDFVLQRAVSEFAAWQAAPSEVVAPVPVGQRVEPPAQLLHRRARPQGARGGRPRARSAVAGDHRVGARHRPRQRRPGARTSCAASACTWPSTTSAPGYSSLLSLKRYPVELVKIDRSFIEGLGRDPDSDAIVTAVMRLAQSLNLTTIAEGVETELQHRRLVEVGCTLAQGYRFGQPRPLDALG